MTEITGFHPQSFQLTIGSAYDTSSGQRQLAREYFKSHFIECALKINTKLFNTHLYYLLEITILKKTYLSTFTDTTFSDSNTKSTLRVFLYLLFMSLIKIIFTINNKH
jgi:hypothetical protein